ncbi:2-C-methyl-D-erythritol 4-phosphate cytidylyltransferase [Rhodoferax sp.]|uniref:2-C-methyl-D-erythritol 4-phosphate cytidylyltransferase n=1 Tax=Rhodoferax sp. TaxID=50421 RepID=UPI00374D0BBD
MTDSSALIPPSATAPRCWALIPCAGSGSRAGAGGPKQYQLLAGQPMVLHTLAAFAAVPRLARTVVVVVAPDDVFFTLHPLHDALCLIAACGGVTRATSVLNGLNFLLAHGAAHNDWVLVHDAARCLIRPDQIDQLIDACWQDDVGGLLALPLPDTLKRESQGRVAATLERADKWLAQTPQMFRIGSLIDALALAGPAVTDEASAMEASGLSPKLVPGSAQNFKVTYPQDFSLAEAVLLTYASGAAAMQPSAIGSRRASDMNFRIGEGWDIHALVAGRKLILGGVEIPYHLGLLGHSDADVLLHAITDALLGAAALGDIGTHFPDTDARFKGADSLVLLTETARRVREQGFEIGNVDSTVIAQAPKLMPYIAAMRAQIALALALEVDQVNVKAKTAEKMGPVGLGQAMEARAMVLLRKFI